MTQQLPHQQRQRFPKTFFSLRNQSASSLRVSLSTWFCKQTMNMDCSYLPQLQARSAAYTRSHVSTSSSSQYVEKQWASSLIKCSFLRRLQARSATDFFSRHSTLQQSIFSNDNAFLRPFSRYTVTRLLLHAWVFPCDYANKQWTWTALLLCSCKHDLRHIHIVTCLRVLLLNMQKNSEPLHSSTAPFCGYAKGYIYT